MNLFESKSSRSNKVEKKHKLNHKNNKSVTTILYIEDNYSNINLIRSFFKIFPNISLICEDSGEDGLNSIYTNQPDLVLLDMKLPAMNGYDVLSAIKSDPEISNIPVIALTAEAMKDQVDRGLNAGFSDYLTKPIDFNALISSTESALN